MTFLDPVCTSDCPIIGAEFKEAGVLLGAADKDVELVAIVANPTYRSVAFTQAFDREEGLNTVPNWLYLTGSLSQLSQVWRQYGIAVENLPAGAMSAHNDLALVIDRTGHIREEVGADPGPGHDQHPVLVLRAAQPVRPPGAERLVRLARLGPGGRLAPRVCAGPIPLAAGCGSQAAPATTPSLRVQTAPLSTSLVTPQGTWAVTVMGGSAASENNFWQLFVRPAGASRWSLVTPEGVADNGGLVARAARAAPRCWSGSGPARTWPSRRWPRAATRARTGRRACSTRPWPTSRTRWPSPRPGRPSPCCSDGSIEAAATPGRRPPGSGRR